MDSRKIVFQETGVVALGELICTAAMLGVFALLGRFDSTVLLGGALGGLLAVGHFFFMAVGLSLAVEKAEQSDSKSGKNLAQSSQMIRLLVLAVVLFALAKSGVCNVIALVLPLAFIRPVLMVSGFFRKKGDA